MFIASLHSSPLTSSAVILLDPSWSPSLSSDEAGPSILCSGRVLPRLPVVNVSTTVPVVGEVVPVVHGRSQGRPCGCLCSSGHTLGHGRSASHST
jgi:hypothetical protein